MAKRAGRAPEPRRRPGDLLPQLDRTNLLQWVLRRRASGGPAGSGAGQKALLHRLIFVARSSPELADKRELAGYWDQLFQRLQRYYHGEAVTGLLLLYPSCVAHVLEASGDVLVSVLRDLRDARQQGRRPLVADPKILVLSHNVPARLFRRWSCEAPSAGASAGPAGDGAEPLEGLARRCLAALLRLGTLLLRRPESSPRLPDNLAEQVPELRGFEAAVGRLLARPELRSPEQFLQAYDSPLHPGLDAAGTWPVPERMTLPSTALERPRPVGTPRAPRGCPGPAAAPSATASLRLRGLQADGDGERALCQSRTPGSPPPRSRRKGQELLTGAARPQGDQGTGPRA